MMMMLTTASKATKTSLLKNSLQFGVKSAAQPQATLSVRSYCRMIASQDLLSMQQRRYGLQQIALTKDSSSMIGNTPIRGFFGRKKEPASEDAKDAKAEEKSSKKPNEKAAKDETPANEEEKETEKASAEDKKDTKESEDKKEETSSSSASSEEQEEEALSPKDVKRIKQLFNE